MAAIEIVKVSNTRLIESVVLLAKEIWTEHYTPLIGKAQVNYMLKKFQSRKAIAQQIKKEGFLYYVLKKDKRNYIGYLGIVPRKEKGELFLSKIYVRAAERRQGYGRLAMDFIEGLARQMNLAKIALTVNKNNTASIKAYRKLGFSNKGAQVSDIGAGFVMDDYRMEKTL